MFTAAMIQAASLTAWVALVALASPRAAAELPEHVVTDVLGPTLPVIGRSLQRIAASLQPAVGP
jgi:hypothetical protein